MNKRQIGRDYETLAVDYLRKKGYTILEKNYHNKLGEIDIIAKDGDTLVAVEVKYRGSEQYGNPLEAVDALKQKKICKTFLVYYTSHGYYQDVPCRFDVIAILKQQEVVHIKNAFEFAYEI